MPLLFSHFEVRGDDDQTSQVVFSVLIGVMGAAVAFAGIYCTIHWYQTYTHHLESELA